MAGRRRLADAGIALLACGLALFAACDNSFSPKADFAPNLVVFCVLDPSSATQTVIVEKTYDALLAQSPKPLTDKEVDSAQVLVTAGGGQAWLFTDTLLPLAGGGTRRVWQSRTMRPKPGVDYALTVTVPGFAPVTAAATVPSRLYVTARLVKPADASGDTSSTILLASGVDHLDAPPMGYFYRLLLQGIRGDSANLVRRELPLREGDDGVDIYPAAARATSASFFVSRITRAYADTYAPDSTIRRIMFVAVGNAMDANFYTYYKAVRGFEDPLSVRIDQPNVSSITGGYGCFGAIVRDTAWYDYAYFARRF